MTALEESQSIVRVLDATRHLFLDNVSWPAYEALLAELEDRGRRLRHTYDQGKLEIMTRSAEHEVLKSLLGAFIQILAEEMDLPLYLGGELTQKRKNVKRGIEPDQCYWLAHEHLVRGKLRINFDRDPPPDLFLEVEVSRTIIDRLAVLAALRIPEVWRFDGNQVNVGTLRRNSRYQWSDRSPSFPGIPIGEIARFLQMAKTTDHLSILREFRKWVREQLG